MQAEVTGKVGQFAVSKQRDKFILEVEKGNWNMFIGFGSMELDGDHCKRRFSGVVGVEARLE